jgi:hypothetical protein
VHDFIRGRLKPREEELEFLHFFVWSIRKMPKMSISAFHLKTIKVPEYTRAMYIIILFVVFLLCNYIYE